jgi:Na+/proline symporter
MTFAVTVEWSKLLEAAYVSAAFGIGVILVAGLAVIASLGAQDRRQSHQGGAVVLNAVTILCVAGIAGAIVLAIYAMTDK